MRAGILLAEESSSAQMSRIARNELYYGRQRGTEEVLADMMKVSLGDLQQTANDWFDPAMMNLAAVGALVGEPADYFLDVG